MRTPTFMTVTADSGRRPGPDRPATLFAAAFVLGACGLALYFARIGQVHGLDAAASYPSMAPVDQYRMASREDEIALARSAAPTSISKEAEVMVLGERGYETASKGTNGFVCLVERSWSAAFDDAAFWNFHLRGPICFNPAAVRSVLPAELERTQWVLAGVSKAEMADRTKKSAAANTMPLQGSIGFMLSRHQYVSDTGGHWHPHLMFYAPRTAAAAWGANLAGSPILAPEAGPEPTTVFYVPVTAWSDGTSAAEERH